MRLSRLCVAVGMLALALPFAAAAQSDGPYISGAFGGIQPGDSDIQGNGINAEAEFDPGFVGAAAIGSAFGKWRAEGEVSYRSADIDDISGAANSSGDVDGLGLMLNGFYDFKNETNWTPYVGVGVGTMRLDVDGVNPIGGARVDEEDWVLAGQAIGGVNYTINDRLGIFTDYRYLVTDDAEATTSAGVPVEAEYSEHRIMIGLRWSFGGSDPAPKAAPRPLPKQAPVAQAAPAPKPAPAPPAKSKPAPVAPEPPQEFLVFFNWDRSDLTDDARTIIDAAAAYSKTVPYVVIKATGHADRSGADRYNMGLSKRRSAAVMAELVRLGVPENDIFIDWKGEREPLVETPDGVREPQNRRVVIVIQK